MGLKLESRKATVDQFIVDHIEKMPSERISLTQDLQRSLPGQPARGKGGCIINLWIDDFPSNLLAVQRAHRRDSSPSVGVRSIRFSLALQPQTFAEPSELNQDSQPVSDRAALG